MEKGIPSQRGISELISFKYALFHCLEAPTAESNTFLMLPLVYFFSKEASKEFEAPRAMFGVFLFDFAYFSTFMTSSGKMLQFSLKIASLVRK